MSLPAGIPNAIIETVLGQLALLFLAGAQGDQQVARQAALRFLMSYRPETEPELELAAGIIGFGFHARQSLHQAMDPDRPSNEVNRLRSGAASLGREAYRCLVKLEQLQKARQAQQTQAQVELVQTQMMAALAAIESAPPAAEPPVEAPMAAPAETPRPAASSAATYPDLSKEAIRRLRPAEQKRIYLARMTENVRRRQAEQAALAAQQSAVMPAATQV
jgi:hypothetical protein